MGCSFMDGTAHCQVEGLVAPWQIPSAYKGPSTRPQLKFTRSTRGTQEVLLY